MNKQNEAPAFDDVMSWLGQGVAVVNVASGDAAFTNGMSDSMAEYVHRIGAGGSFTAEEEAAFAAQVEDTYVEDLLGGKLV